ncbi:hypothetical protein EJ06DRAFT_183449 [Trichodelitschia bisporula]|uniref:Uncharacterized protein n=1 Tax=Trichodelitschia bisporula TaxID=703511 RepID=A0A6G1I710_9PEZI|nr:hypothetical protein EJ06DRAFT_183449 [Trichodelitschia bisporula]
MKDRNSVIFTSKQSSRFKIGTIRTTTGENIRIEDGKNLVQNALGARLGDFFLALQLKNSTEAGSKKRKAAEVVHEAGKFNFQKANITQEAFDRERAKAASPQDFFMLYTQASAVDVVLPDWTGVVDASNWDFYFGPFAGRALDAFERSRAANARKEEDDEDGNGEDDEYGDEDDENGDKEDDEEDEASDCSLL